MYLFLLSLNNIWASPYLLILFHCITIDTYFIHINIAIYQLTCIHFLLHVNMSIFRSIYTCLFIPWTSIHVSVAHALYLSILSRFYTYLFIPYICGIFHYNNNMQLCHIILTMLYILI